MSKQIINMALSGEGFYAIMYVSTKVFSPHLFQHNFDFAKLFALSDDI